MPGTVPSLMLEPAAPPVRGTVPSLMLEPAAPPVRGTVPSLILMLESGPGTDGGEKSEVGDSKIADGENKSVCSLDSSWNIALEETALYMIDDIKSVCHRFIHEHVRGARKI